MAFDALSGLGIIAARKDICEQDSFYIEGERRIVRFASRLEDLLKVVSGFADEPTQERIAEELEDPHSDISLLAEELRQRVNDTLNIDWRSLSDEQDWQVFLDVMDSVQRDGRENTEPVPGMEQEDNE